MSNMNEAIKLAVEKGGYYSAYHPVDWLKYGVQREIVLDQPFWHSLGDALGWEKDDANTKHLYRLSGGNPETMPIGLYKWHRTAMKYFDIYMRVGDLDKFWSDLLTTKKL